MGNNRTKYSFEKRVEKYGSLDEKDCSGRLVIEWYQPYNGDRTPKNTPCNYSKPVFWKCSTCGNIWEKAVNARMRGIGCKVCAERNATERIRNINKHLDKTNFAIEFPYESSEWDFEKNNGLLPSGFCKTENRRFHWICSICGNEYTESIRNRSRGSGCKLCKKRFHTSFPEQAIFYYVQKVYPNAINGYKDIFIIPGMELDIFIPEINIGIEYDGAVWHEGRAADKEKYAICKQNGIKLIRIVEKISDKTKLICDEFIPSIKSHFYNNSFNQVIHLTLDSIGCAYFQDIDIERDSALISARYLNTIKESSLFVKFPEVAEMWHPSANGKTNPKMFSPSSEAKVWWKCPTCGNEWQESIAQLVSTPFCCQCEWRNGRKRSHGMVGSLYNFQNHYPELAKEWDYVENFPLRPDEVTDGSKKKIKWICSKCGKPFVSTVKARVHSRAGCPECKSKTLSAIVHNRAIEKGNTVATVPRLMLMWDFKKNSGKDPKQLARNSIEIVWWKCPDCGHEWQNQITLIYNGTGCSKCYENRRSREARLGRLREGKNIKMLFPELAEEWDYQKNDDPPELYGPESNEIVYWRCLKCGNSYQASIKKRTHKHGCTKCGFRDDYKKGNGDILQVDPNTGKVVARFPTAQDASRKLKIDGSGILKACRGKQKTCGGYKWVFDNSDVLGN